MTELTYNQWLRKGYVVRKGQVAKRYLLPAKGQVGLAVFSEDQVVPIEKGALPEDNWNILVDAANRPRNARKQPTKRKPHVKLRYVDKTLCVWVGSRPDLIALMRERKFRFKPPVHGGICPGRWVKRVTPDQVQAAVNTFEARGYEVIREADPDEQF